VHAKEGSSAKESYDRMQKQYIGVNCWCGCVYDGTLLKKDTI